MIDTAASAGAGETGCRLYLITPSNLDGERLPAFARTLDEALSAGDVACVQLRLKGDGGEGPATEEAVRRAVAELMPVAHAHDVAFLVNDNPALAAELDCDGVHVGQEDTPYEEARRLVGGDRIVGVTCHDSRHLAMEAAEAGADYVAFGAFFATETKAPRTRARPDIVEWWSDLMEAPCVAIGGITADNCAPLVAAGADFLAVSGGVWNHPDGPAAAVRAFAGVIAANDPRAGAAQR